MMGDLAKYSEYVQSYNETKVIEGNKVPKRVYQIVILEPDAVDLNVIKQAKQSVVQKHIKDGEKSDKEVTKEVEQIKKIEGEIKVSKDGDIVEADLPPYEIMENLSTKTAEEKKSVRLAK